MKLSASTAIFVSTLISSAKARVSSTATHLEGITTDGGPHEHETWQTRIVGGSAASRDEYPYFVSWGGCGASLIASDVILSAAHCGGVFTDEVIVSAFQKWWGQASGSAERRSITERIIHPDYSGSTFANDFMVMKLNEPVIGLEPVKINGDPEFPAAEATLTAIGFGTIREGGWGPRLLQEVDVQYVSQEQCNEEYSGDIIEDVMLCAGVQGGGRDSCQGDSGGPIIQKTEEGHFQVGVVSWGRGCARAGYSGVYSRTSGAKSWIDSKICELSTNPPPSCSNIITPVNPVPEPVTSSDSITPVDPVPEPVTSESITSTLDLDKANTEECADSETLKFDVDSINGDQGCDWLRENTEYDYLCKFTDVALKCPVLCDACEIFDQ